MTWQKVVRALLVFTASTAATAQTQPLEVGLSVDLTDAPQKLIHANETIAVTPGSLTLVYPKWIPGEHGPTGPIENMAGFTSPHWRQRQAGAAPTPA